MKSLFRGLEVRRREASVKEGITASLTTAVKEIQFEMAQAGEGPDAEAIGSLCTTLEAIFIHGLKETFADRMSSVLGDPDQRPTPDFWSLIMIFSHRDIIKQIYQLSQVVSDVGRCRAWLRLALNEGLLTSYLSMILQQGGSLRPYYTTSAYLRDPELLSVAAGLLQGLARYTFTLPTNSSILNTWPNSPLLLAGLWTPPIKDVARVVLGTDIAKGIPADPDKFDTTSVSSIPSLTKYVDEDEALKIIMNTPVEGSPIQSRLYLEDSEVESLPSSKNDDHQTEGERWEDSGGVEGEKAAGEEEEEGDEVEEKQGREEEEEEKKKKTWESYDKVLAGYGTAAEVRQPTIEELMERFGPPSVPAPKSAPTSPTGPVEHSFTDFEVIDESSLSMMNVPECKALVEQLGKVMQMKGLLAQNFSCKDCGQLIGLLFAKAFVCSLTGNYYCGDCFKPSDLPLPARILHNWDFTRYPVHGRAALFLHDVHEFPLFDIRRINPRLYLNFREMATLQRLRLELNLLRCFIFTCHDPIKERIKGMVWPREYLYEHVHLYSMADLLEIPNGKLFELLKRTIRVARQHVLSCQLCSQKGFICEICKDDRVIYPFNIDTTYRCNACRTLYHLECKKQKETCPKCERLKERKAKLEKISSID